MDQVNPLGLQTEDGIAAPVPSRILIMKRRHPFYEYIRALIYSSGYYFRMACYGISGIVVVVLVADRHQVGFQPGQGIADLIVKRIGNHPVGAGFNVKGRMSQPFDLHD